MKCKRPGCYNEVTSKQMVYCSRGCAPLGNYGAGNGRSVRTEKSTFKELGEPSEAFSSAEPPRSSVNEDDMPTLPSEQRSALLEKPITGSSSSTSESESAENTGTTPSSALPETPSVSTAAVTILPEEKSIVLGTSPETQLMGLVAPQVSSSAAGSQPQNLLDDTLLHLHGLMKQVAAEEKTRRTSPQMIGAACNLAKNMREIMKLKLDVLKEARTKA
jgi:hypothetical protein